MTDKRASAANAIRQVRDGDHIAVGGTNYARTPMALVFELLRQGRGGLTVSRPLSCYEAELLLATGTASSLMTSWVGIGHNWGLPRVVRHYIENGLARFEEWSHLGLGLRYKAAAMGVPFLPTTTMLGSDLARRSGCPEMTCPFTEQRLLAVPSLAPDVALIHAHRADPLGNAQIDGYSLMDVDMARAAHYVVVSAEKIVSSEDIRQAPQETMIPHFVVDSVVSAPYGAYPHECYGRYVADEDHFGYYNAAVRQDGVEGARRYVADHVTRHDDFAGFLAEFDAERLRAKETASWELMPR